MTLLTLLSGAAASSEDKDVAAYQAEVARRAKMTPEELAAETAREPPPFLSTADFLSRGDANDAAVQAARRQQAMPAAIEAANTVIVSPQSPPPPLPPMVHPGVQDPLPTKTVTYDAAVPGERLTAAPLNQALPGRAAATFAGEGRLTANAAVEPARITLSPEVRQALSRLADAGEATLNEIAPALEALGSAITAAFPVQVGHNNPPELIDELPMTAADVQLGAAAIASLRVELSFDQQRPDVLRLCAFVLDRVGKAALALSRWLAARATVFTDALLKSAGEELGKRIVQASALAAVAHEILQHLP